MARALACAVAGLLSIPLLLGASPTVTGAHPWTIEQIDVTPAGYTSYATSLAVDSSGVPHVAYTMWDTPELRYAVRTPAGWSVEVAHANHSGGTLSLKLDRAGRPHIAFNNGAPENRSLDYATKSGGTWRNETVYSDRPDWICGVYPSLALDSLDRPRIAFTCAREGAAPGERAMYAAWDGARWEVEQVETNDLDPAFGSLAPSLAVGPDDWPHISYFNVTGLELRHAYHDGIRWNVEIVDTGVNLSSVGSSIAVDPGNRVHIAYYDNDRGLLKYARRTDAGWAVDVVDPSLTPGCADLPSVSLALDPSGSPAIAYEVCRPGVVNLGYAWNSTGWSTELVFTEWGNGGSPSLAFDGWGNPHISFVFHMAGRVMYAGVLPTSPDYVPSMAQPSGLVTAEPTQPVPLSVNVTNLGAPWNVSSTIAFHNASTPSSPFARFPIPPLTTLATSGPYVANWMSPSVPGTYAVVASVDYDNAVPERDETNNLYVWTIDVAALPDLVLDSSGLILTPSSPVPNGTSVRVEATVRNIGRGDAPTVTVRFHDGPPPAPPIGTDQALGPVSSGGNGTAAVTWLATPPGTHALCAVADPDDLIREENETNNLACVPAEVLLPADYVPADPAPPSPLRIGFSLPVALSVFVANPGGWTPNVTATLAFHNESASPFTVLPLPPVPAGGRAGPFSISWTSPPALGTYRVTVSVDHGDDVAEADEGNNAFTWTVDVVPGPITSLVVGQPNVTAAVPYVTSSTTLSYSIVDQSGMGIRRTMYRIDGGAWVDYGASGPFTLALEGEHAIEWFSEDNAGNVESPRSGVARVDNTAPVTSAIVGAPRHQASQMFVTSATPIRLEATDGGTLPVGLREIEYRVGGGAWTRYTAPFTLAGPDGARTVANRGIDLLGNLEVSRVLDVVLDDTPPATTIDSASTTVAEGTRFTLAATDGGSGVAVTEFRIDGGPWEPYAGPFVPPPGDHDVDYRSRDNLGNEETPGSVRVSVLGPPPEPNFKPLVAVLFTLLLVVAGAWSAGRRPSRRFGGARTTLAVFTLPFILAEGATGILSFFTGVLAIPPIAGWGTAVDLAILAAGVTVAVVRARGTKTTGPRTRT